jgi:hypothetical protein
MEGIIDIYMGIFKKAQDDFQSNHEAILHEFEARKYEPDVYMEMMSYIDDLFFDVRTLREQNAKLREQIAENDRLWDLAENGG